MSVCHSRSLPCLLGSMALSAILATAIRVPAEEPAANGAKTPDAANASDPAKPAATADDVRQWAKDLDSDIFVKRQEAARILSEAGKAAVGPLAETAEGKSLEATTSAVDILHRLADSADAATRDAAKAALEKLAQGSHAEAARLAKEALTPPQQSPGAVPGGPNFGGGIQFGGNIQLGNGGIIQIQPGGNIQIGPGGNGQPMPGGIQVFRIQANAAGGNRTVDVDDNGKKVHIQEDQNGIEVSVTEKVNGQDKTDKFKAKDADELKKKFPEAHKLYENTRRTGASAACRFKPKSADRSATAASARRYRGSACRRSPSRRWPCRSTELPRFRPIPRRPQEERSISPAA